jgi:acetamidase/formamidase
VTPVTLPLGLLLYELDRREPAVLTVDPGTEVVIETEDAFAGQIRSPGDRRDRVAMPISNPASGPIAVRGARPGDALAVEIVSIEPTLGQCVTYLWPYDYTVAALGSEHRHDTRICRIEDGAIAWDAERSIPYEPLIGTIGVAPRLGVPTTEDAGDYGGNLDLREIGPGATLLLPVQVDDALLVLGDCHAAQGDGELSAAALEMPARVTVRLDLRRDARLPGPRIERDDEIAAVAVAPRLEDAVATAYARLAHWLESEFGIDRWQAYSLLTQVGRLSMGYFQLGVVAAKISRRYLGPVAHRGT